MTIIDKMWERLGFSVKCKSCGSDQIIIKNTLGSSALSGMWGSIDIECTKCNKSGAIYEP